MAGAAAQVTVSTVGLVPEMQEFMARSRAQLAVSLHATTDEVPLPPPPARARARAPALVATYVLCCHNVVW